MSCTVYGDCGDPRYTLKIQDMGDAGDVTQATGDWDLIVDYPDSGSEPKVKALLTGTFAAAVSETGVILAGTGRAACYELAPGPQPWTKTGPQQVTLHLVRLTWKMTFYTASGVSALTTSDRAHLHNTEAAIRDADHTMISGVTDEGQDSGNITVKIRQAGSWADADDEDVRCELPAHAVTFLKVRTYRTPVSGTPGL